MSDAVDRGISVTEIAAMDHPIDASPETTAAFVGRALRGPLNTPVLVNRFSEFRRRFGDAWSRSSLGPAVRQFFDHGGSRLYIVRVANNARGAMLCLPAEGSALILRAVDPGSSERIRAAVDYDRISGDTRFNLTLQRLDPSTGLIVDQEIYRKLGTAQDKRNYVVDALLTSRIARVEQPWPAKRPEPTLGGNGRFDVAWVGHTQDGTDGAELTDYDLVGSREKSTGIFALEAAGHFDLLYLPPRGKAVDTGPAAILAAELLCRRHNAMLVVDPVSGGQTVEDALNHVARLGYASPNMLSYFPRLREIDLERRNAVSDEQPPRAAGGAVAGMLCKLDRNFGPWSCLTSEGIGLKGNLVPESELDDEDLKALARAGVNAFIRGRNGRTQLTGSVTMARGSELYRVFKHLPVRRLCLALVKTIDHATRWAVFQRADARLAMRVRIRVEAYLANLYDIGALADDRFIVNCDVSASGRDCITILLEFQPSGSPAPVSMTLYQSASGCRVASTVFAPAAQHCA